MIVWSAVALVFLLLARYWGLGQFTDTLGPYYTREVGHWLAGGSVASVTLLIDGQIRHFYWTRYLQRRLNRETPALIQDILTIALFLLGLLLGLWWFVGFFFFGFFSVLGVFV